MKIALFGYGLMGKPMATRLLAAEHDVTVYNRNADRAQDFLTQGGKLATTPVQAIAEAECIILMLADMNAITETLLLPDTLAQLAQHSGCMIIQMGTIAPLESQSLERCLFNANCDYLEAPVLGSIPEATNGTLQVMVGGEADHFEQWLPILKIFSKEPRLVGNVGQAAALKLACNQMIASLTSGFCLSLAMVQHFGIDAEHLMTILRNSALYAATFDKKLARYQQRDYERPNFPVQHLAKDVALFLKASENTPLNTSALVPIGQMLQTACDQGAANLDYSALFDMILPNKPN